MKANIYKTVYELTGKVIVDNSEAKSLKNYESLLKAGLFIRPEYCYTWLADYIASTRWNPNSTFYQSMLNVLCKTRFELFIDQILHYASTYGTNFTAEAWIPEHSNLPEFPYSKLTVLETITIPEFEKWFKEFLSVSSALNIETQNQIMEIFDFFGYAPELWIDVIKNRELRYRIREKYDCGKYSDGQDCLMQIIYNITGNTMLVKSRNSIEALGRMFELSKEKLAQHLYKNEKLLSTVFNRNKDVFMAMKNNSIAKLAVNRISKLSKKFHKPMPVSPWLRLEKLDVVERFNLFRSANLFKLVQVYNARKNRQLLDSRLFVIRNGKYFLRTDTVADNPVLIDDKILNEIRIEIISKITYAYQGKTVRFPKNIDLAMPTSQKNFIGDIPIGSAVDVPQKDTLIGIYWRNEWGARDLDLHARTIDGRHFGWNGGYKSDEEVVFSGDMTNADPEASEVFRFRNAVPGTIVSVNIFRGERNVKFRYFVAQDDNRDIPENYMVDPRKVVYSTELVMQDSREHMLGFFNNKGQFVFSNLKNGDLIVPTVGGKSINFGKHMMDMFFMKVKDILKCAGVKVVTDEETAVDYDLTKGAELLKFFSI